MHVSYEMMNFVGICRNEDFSDKREGKMTGCRVLAQTLTMTLDWQCSVDKSELFKVFEGFHPKLLAVMG
jgi:salicylate hydroxylase